MLECTILFGRIIPGDIASCCSYTHLNIRGFSYKGDSVVFPEYTLLSLGDGVLNMEGKEFR